MVWECYFGVAARVIQPYADDESDPLGLRQPGTISGKEDEVWIALQIPVNLIWALVGDGEWYLLGIWKTQEEAQAIADLLKLSVGVVLGYAEVQVRCWGVGEIEEHLKTEETNLFPGLGLFYNQSCVNMNDSSSLTIEGLEPLREFLMSPPSLILPELGCPEQDTVPPSEGSS